MKTSLYVGVLICAAGVLAGCGDDDTMPPLATGGTGVGAQAAGGSPDDGTGGSRSSGTGGSKSSGGSTSATGGSHASTGGSNSSGGSTSTGGSHASTGGSTSTGGSHASAGGSTSTGGTNASGTGGSTVNGSGGTTNIAGMTSVAGATSMAGSSNGGGAAIGSEGGAPGEAGGPGEPGSGGTGGTTTVPESVAWFQCQASDESFVRRAILGVLGRRPLGQAEVNVYTDLIAGVDKLDGYDPDAPIDGPETTLKHSRQLVLDALYAHPDYESNWNALYRDFIRLQRIDEQLNGACDGLRARPADAPAVAAWIRDKSPTKGGDGGPAPTLADVIAGSIELDDVTPIYTANLFSMITKTYDGANATPVALELSRRTDFGAWFDGAYLNRDTTCLTCHNSEFSVTFSADPDTNRFYPVPGLFEKALFGSSTGPATLSDGYGAADREHGMLRYQQMLNINPSNDGTDCAAATSAVITAATTAGTLPNCASGDGIYQCKSDTKLYCQSTIVRTRLKQPWGMATACGQFFDPSAIPLDQAQVQTQFGNITGLRASMWDVTASLRGGFTKLKTSGIAMDEHGNVSDPDEAFAYLVSMNIVEKAWKELTGSPLTIANYYPRNAAARDTLKTLTDEFIASGYSNKALLSAIFASPYLNVADPEDGCGTNLYDMPRIFDPWRMAEEDPSARGNAMTDGIQPVSSRTAARSAYSALGWPLVAYESDFPVTKKSNTGQDPIGTSGTLELQFQTETGYYLKASQPGFRGLDFQARLGWEDRLGLCQKLPTNTNPDLIDGLVSEALEPGAGTVTEFVKVLKDRILGDPSLDDPSEIKQLQNLFGASLEADASTVPGFDDSLRRLCGALVSSPQFLMLGLQPKGGDVPALTPVASSYDALCEDLQTRPLPEPLTISCTSGQPLKVVAVAP